MVIAQVSVERQGLSSASLNTVIGGFQIESSLGQPFVNQWTGSEMILTEGFHQTINLSPLQVQLLVMINDCDKTYEVEIQSISGCQNTAPLNFYWNNTIGSMMTYGLPDFATLRIESPEGCFFEQSYYLSTMNPMQVPCDLRPFNYLSPNADGLNDYFHIENIERPIYKNARVTIFNRWGNLVWENGTYDNQENSWTGVDQKGNALPAGTYFFTIDVIGTSKTGFVELMQ